jgi:hypothetical protein
MEHAETGERCFAQEFRAKALPKPIDFALCSGRGIPSNPRDEPQREVDHDAGCKGFPGNRPTRSGTHAAKRYWNGTMKRL